MNGHHEGVDFTLPDSAGAASWSLLMDANMPEFEPGNNDAALGVGSKYTVVARSLLLFVMRAEEKSQAEPAPPPKPAKPKRARTKPR
jgi:isoamylase